jgi:hypothetical protein
MQGSPQSTALLVRIGPSFGAAFLRLGYVPGDLLDTLQRHEQVHFADSAN